MSDLPFDRVSRSAPFENAGCVFFAPFKLKFVALLLSVMAVCSPVFILELSILRCALIYLRILSFLPCVDSSQFVAQFHVFDAIREQILLEQAMN